MLKKKRLTLYIITLMLFCQPTVGVSAISGAQKKAIVDNCSAIKESLKNTQRADVRARVYFGGRFETVLTQFITPLNVKLVEKNITNLGLIGNQSNFVAAKTSFADDFVKYQQALEELIGIDCKSEPVGFYEKLVATRERRARMVQDIARVKRLISENIKLVTGLKEGL